MRGVVDEKRSHCNRRVYFCFLWWLGRPGGTRYLLGYLLGVPLLHPLLRRFIVMVNLRAMICVDPALANPVLTISKRSFRITSSSQCIYISKSGRDVYSSRFSTGERKKNWASDGRFVDSPSRFSVVSLSQTIRHDRLARPKRTAE